MEIDILKNYVLNLTSISDEEANKFCNLFHYKKIKRKERLLEPGSVCVFEAFVIKGMFKTYHLDKKGVEQILYFSTENWWLADIDSFNNQIPSQLFI